MKLPRRTRVIALEVVIGMLTMVAISVGLLMAPPLIKTWDDSGGSGHWGPFSNRLVKRQIRALDERDPVFEAGTNWRAGEWFMFAVFSKGHVEVPGISPIPPVHSESLFSIKVIAGTGIGAGDRQDELDRLATEFAKAYNETIEGMSVTD